VGSTHEWPVKPPLRPVLYRGSPFASGLLFASAPGWTNGRGQGATPVGELENVREYRGVWNAAVNNHSPWEGGNRIGGRALDNGDGSFVSAPEFLVGAADTRYDVAYGMTAAVLVRPDSVTTDGTLPFFKRMNQPYNATTPGWCFTAAAGNVWRFNYSDGVNQKAITCTTTQNVFRGDLLLVTLVPDGAGGTNTAFHVNGQKEATANSAVIAAVGNPAGTPIKFLGLGTVAAGQPNYSGLVSVGYVWDRVITQWEIDALASDPFAPFRWPELDDGFGGGFQSFHLSM
jgi:Concanavalin A-like lectin/glucanases superfamily